MQGIRSPLDILLGMGSAVLALRGAPAVTRTPRVPGWPLNPPESTRIPLQNPCSRAQPPSLSVWRVEFKSPLAHKETCRSEAYGRHSGTRGVRWGYTVQRSVKSGEHATNAPTGMKYPRDGANRPGA